ncbi:Os07g0693400 [Oryza sativa Japonica Group]|uniref:Os07g0693400 protein n=1 Tax=Oryza sativa subsp. japonica TaxID=39947 RepID=A0A0P0XAX7_ORYSJ|nr:Os07g0693400 [Oryza sativa Japonica Group]
MALSAGDVPTMYTVLVNSLSADEAVRRPAETALAQCEARPGFCSCLLEIISARGLACREDVRLLATIALQLAVLISKIARLDYPKEWPDLFSLLAQQLQSADVLASHRVFMVLFRTLKELSTKRLAVDQRNYAEGGASFEEFLIQSMVFVKSVLECKEYKPSPTGRVINESSQPLSLEQRKKNFGAVASDMLKIVLPDSESFQFLSRYFIYTAKDLEEWSENPESFHHEQNLVQWTEKQRPCAEALFIVIFENYREQLAPVVVSILREAMALSPPLETDVTAGMLLKDAAYTAAGHVYYELSNYLSFNEWFHGSLSIEISNGHPNMRIIRRKIALLLGQWISEIKGDTRKLVYHALVGLLQDNDIAVRVQVLNFISVLLEHAGDKVIPFASQLSHFFQKIWDESAGESLLQIQLLAALRTFISSVGYQSPLSYHMLIPILQSGINVDSPDALNLLEDSVLLWETTLLNAPSIVSQLLDLFPYLVGIVTRSFDHLEKLIFICLNQDDEHNPSRTTVRASAGAILARLLVMNTNFTGKLLSEPALLTSIQQTGISVNNNLLLSLVDMWIDKVDDANVIQQKEYAMALSVILTLHVPQVIDKLDDILSVCTTVIMGGREVKTEDDTSGDITSSSWLGNDNSGYSNTSKELRKRQVKDSDPIKQASLEDMLRDNLKACAALHGDATFNAAIGRIHPAAFAQLQQALNIA